MSIQRTRRRPAVSAPRVNWPGDVAIIPAVAEADCSLKDNDAMVRVALSWAKRTTGAGVPDVAHICAVLGVDLSGAIERARGVRGACDGLV